MGSMNAFLRDRRLGLVWLAARLWVGWQFLHAGWEKTFGNEQSAWWGHTSGVHGFLSHAASPASTSGAFPPVSHWYAAVIDHVFLHLERFFAIAIPLGELLVGIGLILGLFTMTAAFFGVVLNLAFLLAGSTSAGLNPLMLVLGLLIMAAGPAAYEYGVDRVVQPRLRARLARGGGTQARPRPRPKLIAH
jgi:thiosulfate dehydrogenase [quinone] large subunit